MSRLDKITQNEIFQYENLMEIFRFFCMKHEEQQHKCLKLIQIIFFGESLVLEFLGQKGTQNLFLGFITN